MLMNVGFWLIDPCTLSNAEEGSFTVGILVEPGILPNGLEIMEELNLGIVVFMRD